MDNSDTSIRIGDAVNNEGSNAYGTVKFVGQIASALGIFVGIELDPVFAGKGKNDGGNHGVQHFEVATPLSGVFVPIARVQKRALPQAAASQTALPQEATLPAQASPPEEKLTGQDSSPALPPWLSGNTVRTLYALDKSMVQAHRRDDYDTAESTARILLEHAELPLLLRARACMILGCSENADSLTLAEEGVRIAELRMSVAGTAGKVETQLLADCKDVYDQALTAGGEEARARAEAQEERDAGDSDEEGEGAEGGGTVSARVQVQEAESAE